MKCGTYTFSHTVDGSTRRFTIIDTPGLADKNTADENLEILQGIANELRQLDQERVSSVIYFHSIENPKFDAIHKENVRVLKAICGEKFFPHVAFVTTRWNHISREAYPLCEDRHSQLEVEFQNMLPGSRTYKFHTDGMSHLQLIDDLARSAKPNHQLQFVRELERYRQKVKISAVKKTTVGKQITAKRKVRSGICTFL